MKNTLDGKIVRSKSSKDVHTVELGKLVSSKRNVFNACIGRPFDEVNYCNSRRISIQRRWDLCVDCVKINL